MLEYSKEDIIQAKSIKIGISDVLNLNFNLLLDKNNKTKLKKTTIYQKDGITEYLDASGAVCFSDFGFKGLSRLESQRLTLFKEKGTVCACCGLEATHFRKDVELSEQTIENLKKLYRGTFHLNLYGLKDGEDVLFTKDHIIAKSNGGLNIIENYATMCTNCNRIKGSYQISLKEFKKLYLNYTPSEIKTILDKNYK